MYIYVNTCDFAIVLFQSLENLVTPETESIIIVLEVYLQLYIYLGLSLATIHSSSPLPASRPSPKGISTCKGILPPHSLGWIKLLAHPLKDPSLNETQSRRLLLDVLSRNQAHNPRNVLEHGCCINCKHSISDICQNDLETSDIICSTLAISALL